MTGITSTRMTIGTAEGVNDSTIADGGGIVTTDALITADRQLPARDIVIGRDLAARMFRVMDGGADIAITAVNHEDAGRWLVNEIHD